MIKLGIDDVISCAAGLVDAPGQPEVSEEYRRGVVALASALCLGADIEEFVEVMGYAICGVYKTSTCEVGPVAEKWQPVFDQMAGREIR